MKTSNLTTGKIALALALIAVLVPFLISFLFKSSRDFIWINGPNFILGLELIAFVLGILSWRTLPGKIGVILSIGISLLLVGYLSIV